MIKTVGHCLTVLKNVLKHVRLFKKKLTAFLLRKRQKYDKMVKVIKFAEGMFVLRKFGDSFIFRRILKNAY